MFSKKKGKIIPEFLKKGKGSEEKKGGATLKGKWNMRGRGKKRIKKKGEKPL